MLDEDTKTNEKQKSSFNFYFAFVLHVSPLPPPLSQIFSTFEDNLRKARSLFAISKLSLFNNLIYNFFMMLIVYW